MRLGVLATAVFVLSAGAVQAQDIKIPLNIENLASKAVDSVNITVDGALLQIAGKFLSADDPEQKAVKSLLGGLKGIYVRSFEFAKVGEYASADLDALRNQLKAPGWAPMVNVRSSRGGENVDVFLKMDGEKIAGLVVIAGEALRLTIVNIVGSIDLEQLASLSGNFGIPKLEVEPKKR
jgi:hypothetical protein